jgi:hypothetical protein
VTTPQFDITPFLRQDERQHFDRKSLFEGPDGGKSARNRRAVRDQVAKYVAAFANADGGLLLLGIENNGTVTGHTLPDALQGPSPPDWGEQLPDWGEKRLDRGEQPTDRGEQAATDLPPPTPFTLRPDQHRAVAQLGQRPRNGPLRAVIELLCADDWVSAADLAQVLDFSAAKLTERHLTPMVQEGRLQRRYPDLPTHARQAYRATLRQHDLPFGNEPGGMAP